VSHRPAIRRLAFLLSLFTVAALIAALPVTPLVGSHKATAHAAVAVGDVVFVDTSAGGSRIAIRDSGGDITDLTPSGASTPDVSPDGSRIAFAAYDTCVDYSSYHGTGLMVMNSDGSGRQWLTQPRCHAGGAGTIEDTYPRWSPDGTEVAYVHHDASGYGSDTSRIYKVNADGSGATALTTTNFESDPPSWSPDGSKIVYDTWPGYHPQLYIMDADGTDPHLLPDSDSGYGESYPTWSPDGDRIYFVSSGAAFFWYWSSEDDFATTDVTRNPIDGATHPNAEYDLSADGSTLVYRGLGTSSLSGCNELWTLDISGETSDQVTSDTCSGSENPGYIPPRYVKADWPPAVPSNATVALSAPLPSDAPYARQITIALSASGIEKFQYGWSTSNSTAPNTSYLQESTDLSTPKMGTLDYRGKYSGSGTTWNGGTGPDDDWYLWVRSVQTGGTPNSWGTPLKVHTPKKPIWVVVGDSYSSGHHQDADEPLCPDPEDSYSWLTSPACSLTGAPHVVPLDPTLAWATEAVGSFNAALHVPSEWQITLGPEDVLGIPAYFLALSGTPTSAFGASGEDVGSNAWATGAHQTTYMSAGLNQHRDSWNVVSETGGANDTTWTTKMKDWYNDNAHFVSTPPKPWMQESSTSNCPDSDAIFTELTDNNDELSDAIQANLQGVVDVAVRESPGVRVLNLGYPEVNDSSDSSDAKSYCYSNHGTSPVWHGTQSVIAELNSDHQLVTGDNVQYVDLVTPFGSTPIHSGDIQATRYYGYPHATSTGQTLIADAAIDVLTNEGLWS